MAFNEHQLKNSASFQKTINRHQALYPAVIAVFALFSFFYFKDIPASIYALLLAMAWGLGGPFYLKWNALKQIRNSYTEAEKAAILGHYTLKAEPNGLAEIDAAGETSKLPWKKVLRVETEKKYVFVFVSLDSALIIPIATVSKDSKLGEFVKAANDYIEKAG
jgi:hypothetical protein